MKIRLIPLKNTRCRVALISIALAVCICLSALSAVCALSFPARYVAASGEKSYIKWVDFNVSYAVMKQALDYDIAGYGKKIHIDWISLLAMAACVNGGSFTDKSSPYIDELARELNDGATVKALCKNAEYYDYYYQAYSAVLSGIVGEYTQEKSAETGGKTVTKYGVKAFSPIADGYGYSHSDDFGMSRSFGFKRRHLGNDLIGSVGTPIIAVEDGIIENIGWNRYGGWRIGIRSYDTRRYYYYAHLRSGHPYAGQLMEGMEVKAGDVIGYLGMTGYSDSEDYNGMTTPHLHFGMQLVFDESQINSDREIWIDVYDIVRLLRFTRSRVVKNEQTGEYEALRK